MDAAIWGFIGTGVGALTSIITTFISNSHSAKLQTQSNSSKRIELAKEFQRILY